MTIKYSPSFLEIFKKVDVRIRKSFKQRILIFSKNHNDLQLNNHELTKEWLGYRSIDITADYRFTLNPVRIILEFNQALISKVI